MISADRLTTGTRNQIALAHKMLARDIALVQVATLLDPGNNLSTNGRAEALSGRLRAFLAHPWPSIESGSRAPRGPLESAMTDLAKAGCPTSARRLFDVLAELRL